MIYDAALNTPLGVKIIFLVICEWCIGLPANSYAILKDTCSC
jgi:hypothetical protein